MCIGGFDLAPSGSAGCRPRPVRKRGHILDRLRSSPPIWRAAGEKSTEFFLPKRLLVSGLFRDANMAANDTKHRCK